MLSIYVIFLIDQLRIYGMTIYNKFRKLERIVHDVSKAE